jgi:hypothetical protein
VTIYVDGFALKGVVFGNSELARLEAATSQKKV